MRTDSKMYMSAKADPNPARKTHERVLMIKHLPGNYSCCDTRRFLLRAQGLFAPAPVKLAAIFFECI